MASSGEGALEGPRNFYCHQCHSRTRTSAEEFSCASCGSGFIEEINDDDGHDGEDTWMANMPMFGGEPNILEQLFGNAVMGPGAHVTRRGFPVRRRPPGAGGGGADQEQEGLEQMFSGDQFLSTLISNLMGVPFDDVMLPRGGGFMPGGNVMYGNPGDYVLSVNGLDAIASRILNQYEPRGPPPMAKEEIDKEVPMVKVSQRQIDEKLQCSVCWDDFKLDESVKQLDCEHIFHPDCIVPWLELHATCPVCRKPLTADAKADQERADREYNGDNDGTGGAGGGSGSGSSSSSQGQSSGSGHPSSWGAGASSGGASGGHSPSRHGNPFSDAINPFMVMGQLMGRPPSSSTSQQEPVPSNDRQHSNQQRNFQDFDPE